MTHTLKMDAPQARRLDETAQGVIGQPLDRPEGPLKVRGAAPYTADHHLPGMAVGVLVRAQIPRGRVTALNEEEVREMPGVLGVWSDERFLRNPAQGGAGEAPVQGPREVAYLGQPIALVVAETFEQARDAAETLLPDYEEEIPEVDPDSAGEVDRPEGKQSDQGDIDAVMAEAAATVDATYTTPPHHSAAMEPHAAIASWEGDRLTLHGSYQMLRDNQAELADSLGIPQENVRILSAFVGGGFGSKLGISHEAVTAAIAARELGRPVRVVLSRQQVFEATMRRSETRQRIRLAADAEGRLLGLAHEDRVSNLPGETFSEPTAQATHFLYAGAARRYTHEVARVNRTCAGSVRAPGEAVGMLAIENAMDELAHELGMDPVELRRRNIPERHPERDVPYSARGLAQCLDEGARRFGWDARPKVPGSRCSGRWFLGMGVATAARINMLAPSQARVTLDPSGRAVVETDMTDIGTGTYAILGQIAAEMLGLPRDRVEVRLGDTDLPPACGSGGSVGASSSGSSVFLAALTLRRRIAQRMGCDEAELTLRDGAATAANRRANLSELLDGPESEVGEIKPGETRKKVSQAAYGAHFAEVAVNADTGETRVRRMLGVFAAGRILNRKTAASQCRGGMIWGIGSALTEEIAHDPRDGHIVNRDLAEYHLPVNLDVPPIEIVFVDERDDHACPIQSKGIGELGISGAGAAVTNAIFNACGVRVRDYPATLDKLLSGLPE